MLGAPVNIRRFEVLQLVSIFAGLIHTLVDGTLIGNVVRAASGNAGGGSRGYVVGSAIGAAIGYVVGVAIFIALTLLVSRRRKNWARWTVFVFFVLGGSCV